MKVKVIGIVAGVAALSLLAVGAKKCHGMMAKMQEHCGGGQVPACGGCQDAKTDPGEAGETEACAEACTEG